MTKVRKTPLSTAIRQTEFQLSNRSHSSRLHIHFWLHKSKKAGYANIYCRLTFQGRRFDASTGIHCRAVDYNRAKETIQDDEAATLLLADLRAKINATHAEFRLTNRPVNLRLIWQVANGQHLNVQIPDLGQCMDLFMKQIDDQLDVGELARSSYNKLTKWDKRLRDFALYQYGPHALLEAITPADAKRLLLYLKKNCDYSNNVAVMIVQHLKRILNFALENEWITRNPFMNYRRKFERIKGDILTEAELDAIRAVEIFAPVLDHIRKAFVFQCYTGLSYKELCTVTEAHILPDAKTGTEYIQINRQKTGVPSIVPLVLEARRIIDEFADHPARLRKGLLIPILSNQKYNHYLKHVAGMAGIKKRLTSHVARRTAGTYYLSKGVPMESVSALLGHTNTATTQRHYTITRPERVIGDLSRISNLSKAQ